MSRGHVCPGEEHCRRCQARIDAAEFPEPDDAGWQGAQDAWEVQWDRQGGSS